MVTLASKEEHIDVLTWIFVSEAGSSNRLRSETSESKYTITQTDVGSSVKSQLIVNNLQESDEGSYYCQAEFSNGTALSRSQEINVFDRRAYSNLPICNESRVESVKTSRCVLFTSEVVQPLPPTDHEGATTSSTTTTTGNGNGTQSKPSTVAMVSDQSTEWQGEGEGEADLSLANVLLYSAIAAVVFLVFVIIVLVVCICLCNRAYDWCQLCS